MWISKEIGSFAPENVFLKKLFLGSQLPISLEIHRKFRKIQHIGKNVRARRFGHILNQAQKIQKKSKNMQNLRTLSCYVT